MMFEWKVDIGSLINASTLIVVAWRLGVLQFKLEKVWRWFEREHGIEQ